MQQVAAPSANPKRDLWRIRSYTFKHCLCPFKVWSLVSWLQLSWQDTTKHYFGLKWVEHKWRNTSTYYKQVLKLQNLCDSLLSTGTQQALFVQRTIGCQLSEQLKYNHKDDVTSKCLTKNASWQWYKKPCRKEKCGTYLSTTSFKIMLAIFESTFFKLEGFFLLPTGGIGAGFIFCTPLFGNVWVRLALFTCWNISKSCKQYGPNIALSYFPRWF